jgi:hypothetical protein
MASAERDGQPTANPLGDAAEGVEHLHTAAKEMIRAARSLLDAAEGLVDDPKVVQGLAGTLTDLAGAAAAWLRTSPLEPEGDGGQVQRIDLS